MLLNRQKKTNKKKTGRLWMSSSTHPCVTITFLLAVDDLSRVNSVWKLRFYETLWILRILFLTTVVLVWVIVTENLSLGWLGLCRVIRKNLNKWKAIINELAVILRNKIALWAAHMIVNKFLLFIFDNWPTQSMITLSKGTSVTGIGCKGAGGITWFGLL